MPSFWKHVNTVIDKADILLEVLDARMVDDTRHEEIEEKIRKRGKLLLYVINKCDLADRRNLDRLKRTLRPSVFVSSTEKLGTTILKKKILELSKGKPTVVGILGYPNVGKSSLLNALAGKGAARTSAESGFTRGLQNVRVGSKLILIDTPGVFPQRENNELKYSKTGALSYGRIKDAETAALHLIAEHQETIAGHYGVQGASPEEVLEQIALDLKMLQKRGAPNLDSAARKVLKDWQTGKI